MRTQCAGDVVSCTAAVKALHVCQPGRFVTDYVGYHPAIFENNPYITKLGPHEGQLVDTDYGTIPGS